MIPVGSLWRVNPKNVTEWEENEPPVRFNKDGGFVDVDVLEPGFVVLSVEQFAKPAGSFHFLMKILRLPTPDDPPYRGTISYPACRAMGWDKKMYQLWWDHYFERLG